MKRLAILLALLLVSTANAQETTNSHTWNGALTNTAPVAQTFQVQSAPRSFVLHCGNGGKVTISMQTGDAEFDDCAPNDAAKVFWEAVSQEYRETKRKVENRP